MKKIALFVIPFLLLGTLSSIYFTQKAPDTTFSANDSISKDLNEELAKCVSDGDQRKCFTNYFTFALSKGNAKELANQIYLYRTAVPTATQYCHDQALAIGDLAWKQYGDLDVILKFGTPVCASGFLHGVQEAIGRDENIDAKKMLSMVSKVCEVITNNDFRDSNYRVCYHGIGHAVYQKLDKVFQDGMDVCLQMSDAKDKTDEFNQSYTKRELCAEGYAMRFFEPMQPMVDKDAQMPTGKPTNILENPYVLCDKLTDLSLRYGCFEYGTRAFGHTELAYNREAYLCNLYTSIDATPCYFGISRELAYTAETDTFTNVDSICAQAKDFNAGYVCGFNAILNRITINNNLEEPVAVCNKLRKTKLFIAICDTVRTHLTLTSSENKRGI